MGPDVPDQSADRTCRSAELHLAVVTDRDAAKEHAQWLRSDMKDKIDTRTREDPGASFVMGGGGPVVSAWVAEACNRISGLKLTEVAGRVRADPAREARGRELEVWEQFKVSSAARLSARSRGMVDTRSALTWKEVGGVKTAKARLVAKGYQDPDLRNGNVDIAGRVSRRSPHFQLMSLGALNKWSIWSLDFKNAFRQADGFDRGIPRMVAGLGECGHQRMVLMALQLRFVGPCAITS